LVVGQLHRSPVCVLTSLRARHRAGKLIINSVSGSYKRTAALEATKAADCKGHTYRLEVARDRNEALPHSYVGWLYLCFGYPAR